MDISRHLACRFACQHVRPTAKERKGISRTRLIDREMITDILGTYFWSLGCAIPLERKRSIKTSLFLASGPVLRRIYVRSMDEQMVLLVHESRISLEVLLTYIERP